MSGWFGVDLDGTLARYDGWLGVSHIGEPIAPMVERVKAWLADGKDVRIFTARVARLLSADPEAKIEGNRALHYINEWCMAVFGRVLPVTCIKDFGMIVLYDDRAIQVEANTGRLIIEDDEP